MLSTLGVCCLVLVCRVWTCLSSMIRNSKAGSRVCVSELFAVGWFTFPFIFGLRFQPNEIHLSCLPHSIRSAGDRRAAPSSGRAQTESCSRGSVPVGGSAQLPAPPHDHVLHLPLPSHGLQPHAKPQLWGPPSSCAPLHPSSPAASVSWRAAVRHAEPGELWQHGHQRVNG